MQIYGIIYLKQIIKFMSFILKKKLLNLYNFKPSGPFLLSFGILVGGTSFTMFLNLFLGVIDQIYIIYALFTWFWLRIVEILFNILSKKNNKLFSFSLSWQFPILLICLLGLFHIKLPIYFLASIALIDLLLFFLINIYKNINLSWQKMIIGFVAGSIIIGLSNIHTGTLPWINELAYVGIVGTDYLRDAAVANSWSEYSSISHGIHGLLFEPYHVLFAIFIDPFISDTVNVIKVFTILANIMMPTFLIYGCSKLIIYMGSTYISKNWLLILMFFILTFASIDYVLGQRSLLIATLLYISVIPLLYYAVSKSKINNLEIIVLSFLVPVTIFARAFHGLFLLGLICYFLSVKKNSQKIIILSSIIFSFLFIILYFGQTDRASSAIGFGYYQYFLNSSDLYINSFLIPIILFIFFLILKKNPINLKNIKQIVNNKFLFFLLFACLLILVLALRTSGYSDTFYQLLPTFWFLFFFLITPEFKLLLFTKADEPLIFDRSVIKYFLLISLFIVSIAFFKKHLVSINNDSGTLKHTVKSVRILNDNWNFQKDNKFLMDDVNINYCKKNKFDIFCEIRSKLFGLSKLNEFTNNVYPKRILQKAKDISLKLNGTTAIYISPKNQYWSFFQYKEGVVTADIKSSLYFMALGKMPLIFGVKSERTDLAYSINTAHKNFGTLKNLDLLGTDNDLCSHAKKVKVDNIILFGSNLDTRILKCN